MYGCVTCIWADARCHRCVFAKTLCSTRLSCHGWLLDTSLHNYTGRRLKASCDDGADVVDTKLVAEISSDVGHNSLACEFVIRSLSPVIPRSRRVVIFGALGDKDIDSMLPILRAYTGRVALVGVGDHGDGKSTRLRRRGRCFLDRRIGGVLATLGSRYEGAL